MKWVNALHHRRYPRKLTGDVSAEKSSPAQGVTAQSFALRSGEWAGLKFNEMVFFPQLNSNPIHISD